MSTLGKAPTFATLTRFVRAALTLFLVISLKRSRYSMLAIKLTLILRLYPVWIISSLKKRTELGAQSGVYPTKFPKD